MSIMEVLTLLLVVFEVLSYIDGHYYKKSRFIISKKEGHLKNSDPFLFIPIHSILQLL